VQFLGTTGAAALLLLFGTTVPAHGQQDQRNEDRGKLDKRQDNQERQVRPQAREQQRGPSQEGRGQAAQPPPPQQQRVHETQRQRPEQQPQLQRRAQQQRSEQSQQQRPQPRQEQRPQQARQQPQRTNQQAVAWQQKRGWVQQGAWREHSTWQQGRARHWESDHRTWAQRGGYGGYYIPQARFSLYFGSQHGFRMRSRPTMYMGYPRFSYGGFSFLLVDPWPEYWSENWYDTDDLYIGYDDGYYLHNRRYPAVGLAITVVM
jgi:hypothetical protein